MSCCGNICFIKYYCYAFALAVNQLLVEMFRFPLQWMKTVVRCMICAVVILLKSLLSKSGHLFRAKACNAMHGIAVTILSVRPSVCQMRVL